MLFAILSEIQDFPARVQRQAFDDVLDKDVQRGEEHFILEILHVLLGSGNFADVMGFSCFS